MSDRPLPVIDKETGFFWTSGADGRLRINRCDSCGHYQQPPLPRCPACHGEHLTPTPVSGRGRVASFTINHEKWTPRLTAPFVFAAIELEEQAELYVFTNLLCPIDAARIGMTVSVCFEQHDDVYLPFFAPDEADHAR